jgi:serine/threonine protein kinase
VTDEGTVRSQGQTATSASDDAYLDAVAAATESSPRPPTTSGMPEGWLPTAGQMLADKYRVERLLGGGGMGVVVAARHVHLDLLVALKFMNDETVADSSLVARFLREARATAKLRGEHVVRVSDVGELDSGAPYMVMEFLQGQDLAALLASLGTPPIASAVEYAIQACEGLDEAHRAGIVHRDVKPANLFLTRRPNGTACIKVVDFGISKGGGGDTLHSTSSRAMFGSPLYMAPEQMRATHHVDARADLWSLGASLYELLSGEVPFAAESLVDLAYRIANEAPPSLQERRPEVPPELERIVMRCLEKDPDCRFADARSLANALEAFRQQRSWPAPIEANDDEETRVMDSPAAAPPSELAGHSELTLSAPSIETISVISHVSSSPLPPRPVDPEEPLSSGSVSWAGPQPVPARRRDPRAYVVAGIVACGVVAGIAFLGREEPRTTPSVAIVTSFVGPAVDAGTTRIDDPPVVSQELPTVSVMDLPMAPTPPAPPPPPRAPTSPHEGTPAGSPSPSAVPDTTAVNDTTETTPPSPAKNCSPPYFYDELGLKHFKPECF